MAQGLPGHHSLPLVCFRMNLNADSLLVIEYFYFVVLVLLFKETLCRGDLAPPTVSTKCVS